jgi:hypothetical protein
VVWHTTQMIEEETTVLRTVRIPPEIDQKVREISFSRGIRKGELIVEYIEAGIRGEPPTVAERTQDRGHVLKLIDELHLLSGTVGDLRKGFAPGIDPKRWVEKVQARIERTLAAIDVQDRFRG